MNPITRRCRIVKQNYVMPVGVDDFRQVREEYYYVDKTDFIQALIDGHSKVTLITRPRRFGKTLAMSMLYYFFTMEDAGANRNLFKGCKIEAAGEKYMKHQGTKPTIFLSLKDIKQVDFTRMMRSFSSLMQDLYALHSYLLDSDCLNEYDREYFHSIVTRQADSVDLQLSLKKLTVWLQRYHQKAVLLLIDEYDAPIQYAFDHDYYDEAIEFMRNYLSSALKSNSSLDFAVITGVLRIAKESIFSSLNNLEIASVVSGRYQSAMGFDYHEIEQVATDFNCPQKLEEIKDWYDGYNFSGQEIYNPWSVINYILHNCQPALYWLNTSGNTILNDLLKHIDKKQEKELYTLLRGDSITARIDESIIYTDISKSRNALYTMLLTTGYLTPVSQPSLTGFTLSARLRIPNQEIRAVYAKEILERIESMDGQPNLLSMMDNLLSGNAEEFSARLNEYLETLASYYDTANRENFYHGFLLGLLALLLPDYTVRSNRESGYGRFDIAIFPNRKHQNGVIMEFKVAESEAALPKMAEAALTQIESMDYMAEFRNKGITPVWQYGIAFCGKKSHIEAKS
ncbi:MAG: AAA family ATPase [Selenomonas sp.]|nr:AAA family ATPase [Selenomonas sp.]